MLKLCPVSFVYKHDSNNNKQFGLIAEEVNEIYPELIVRDERGEIFTINYIELIPLLLKQIQELEMQVELLQEQVHEQEQMRNALGEHTQRINELYALVTKLTAALHN